MAEDIASERLQFIASESLEPGLPGRQEGEPFSEPTIDLPESVDNPEDKKRKIKKEKKRLSQPRASTDDLVAGDEVTSEEFTSSSTPILVTPPGDSVQKQILSLQQKYDKMIEKMNGDMSQMQHDVFTLQADKDTLRKQNLEQIRKALDSEKERVEENMLIVQANDELPGQIDKRKDKKPADYETERPKEEVYVYFVTKFACFSGAPTAQMHNCA